MSFHSRYTPSQMSGEDLEALFVQREELARRLVDHVRVSAFTGNKHHDLLVGPRGTGKTHLISVVHHRVMGDRELNDRLAVAWLPEDPWGIASYATLLLTIIRTLKPAPTAAILDAAARLSELETAAAERRGQDLLLQALGTRTLLLIAENLPVIFEALGARGQAKLRAFVQESGNVAIVATACSLDAATTKQSHPFFGFFSTHHLAELTLDESVELLRHVAEREGKKEPHAFLATPQGRARVRALRHLAGGNHRIHVVFASFLSAQKPDDVMEPLLRTLDDLTPYYQSRMAELSAQQRQVVQVLSEHRGALPVGEIARRCLATSQTVSSQLRLVREAGFVRSEAVGRESYYELREPMMRLCVEAKQARTEPLKVLVELLCAWFGREELETGAPVRVAESPTAYRAAALSLLDSGFNPRRDWLLDDLRREMQGGWSESAQQAVDDLVAACTTAEFADVDDPDVGIALHLGARHAEAAGVLRNAVRANPEDIKVLVGHAVSASMSGHLEEGLDAARRATGIGATQWIAWASLGIAAERSGELAEALAAVTRAAVLEGRPPGLKALELLLRLGRTSECFKLLRPLSRGERRDRARLAGAEASMAKLVRELDQDLKGRHGMTVAALGSSIRELVLGDAASQAAAETLVPVLLRIHLQIAREHDFLVGMAPLVMHPLTGGDRAIANKSWLVSWLAVWQDVGSDVPSIREAVRMAKAARRFLLDDDRRHLLALAQEERDLVERILQTPAARNPDAEAMQAHDSNRLTTPPSARHSGANGRATRTRTRKAPLRHR